jgi:hypothetical protein
VSTEFAANAEKISESPPLESVLKNVSSLV